MAIPTDPLYLQQWHLTGLNVQPAWNNYTGAGIRVVVLDDGFDYNHPDLAPNYDQTRDWDYVDNDADPGGGPHGTCVAGLIAADDNGAGVVGVAFDASLVGYRVSGTTTDNTFLQHVRDALHDAAINAHAHVVNMSLGLSNDIESIFGAGGYSATALFEIGQSISTAVNSGRSGYGTILVKAAGNARSDGPDPDAPPGMVGINDNYDVNADPWGKDTRQIVVAAVDQDGTVSGYSSFGAPILVSAYGSRSQVVTTDGVGDNGYNTSGDNSAFDPTEATGRNAAPSDTNFNFAFAGTSAAAPMVSGVVALMLQANPYLGWRDVQDILAYSARHTGTSPVDGVTTDGIERTPWDWNGATNWNGGGLHFSNDYGYGLVDASAAVHLAETWSLMDVAHTSYNEAFTVTDAALSNTVIIPDGNRFGSSFGVTVGSDQQVDRVTLRLQFSTTCISDLEVYLTSPGGTTSELVRDIAEGNAPDINDFNGYWTFESQAFRGESSAGNWSVRIVDDTQGDTLTVSDIVLTTFGQAASIDDRYIFTNEYFSYAGAAGHRTSVLDVNGGQDWIDAAAVTFSSVIDLGGWNSVIAANSVTLVGIENAIGGDGGDSLIGNSSANELHGMRGADLLDGGPGVDRMFGGVGDDQYYVDNGADTIFEFANEGTDTVFTSTNYTLFPGDFIEAFSTTNDHGTAPINLTGNTLTQWITGNDGKNIIDGGGGIDVLDGRGGDDQYIVRDPNTAIIELPGGGTDQVLTTLTYVIPAAAEIETLSTTGRLGTAGINLYGNDFANSLIGNAANNTLKGGGGADRLDGAAGNDTMVGGAGDDIYIVDSAADTVSESVGGGTDQVFTSVTYVLPDAAEIETLATTDRAGTAGINLYGNDFANSLIGNAANNTMKGGGGADRLDGALGADTLNGGAGDDVLTGGLGNDTINGGPGFDTAVVSGHGSSYTIAHSGATVTVSGPDGTDTLTGVEKLQFDDGYLQLSDWSFSDLHSDFGSDGRSDILWQQDGGLVALWQMNGAQKLQADSIASVGPDWHVAGVGDFNGDGKSDILWRQDSGLVALWQMNGAQKLQSDSVASVGPDWHIAGVGDFNGDGKSDILWRHDSGLIALWQMNGAQKLHTDSITPVGLDWHIAGVGDFNGDGKSDILWRQDSGLVALWQMNGAQKLQSDSVASVGPDWHIAGVGDFNGDGKSDILWRQDGGLIALWQMNGAQKLHTDSIASVGFDWHIAGVSDFNGDSKSDILWRQDSGLVALWQMDGAQAAIRDGIANVGNDWQITATHFDLI